MATAHCASEDFYDSDMGGGRNQNFHLVCFSVGEKRNHIQTSRQGLCKTVHRSERIKDSKKSTGREHAGSTDLCVSLTSLSLSPSTL